MIGPDPNFSPPAPDTPEQIKEAARREGNRHQPSGNPYPPGSEQAKLFDREFKATRHEIATGIRGTIMAGAGLGVISNIVPGSAIEVTGWAIRSGAEVMTLVRMGRDLSEEGEIPQMDDEEWLHVKLAITQSMLNRNPSFEMKPIHRMAWALGRCFIHDLCKGKFASPGKEIECFACDPAEAIHWVLKSGRFA